MNKLTLRIEFATAGIFSSLGGPLLHAQRGQIHMPNRDFTTSVNARIFRDFLPSDWLIYAIVKINVFHKPLHFNAKYDFIE